MRRSVIASADAALIIGGVFAAWRLAPHLVHAAGDNSDAAIPVLMANHGGFSPYDLYYWGQDRFGAWPFLLARVLHLAAGVPWTPDGLYWLLVIAIACAAWPLRRLAGESPLWASSAFLMALLLGCPSFVLRPSQPYGWSLTPLFSSWWLVRGIAAATSGAPVVRRQVALAVGTFLGSWMSPACFVLLAVLATVELAAVRDRLRAGLRIAASLVVGLGGALLIHVLHGWGSRNARLPFQETSFGIDRGHLGIDLVRTFASLRGTAAWVAAPLSAGLACLFAWRQRARREGGTSGLLTLAIGLSVAAWANFVLVALATWTRSNNYHFRYLAPTYLFSVLSLALEVVALLPDRLRASSLRVGVALAAGTFSILFARRAFDEARNEDLEVASAQLSTHASGAGLLGDYWNTYVFVDSTVPRPLVPVVTEAEFNRSPFDDWQLAVSDPVIVAMHGSPRFAAPGGPVRYIYEHAALLELEQANWLNVGPYSFALYRNHTADLVPGVRVDFGKGSRDSPCGVAPCMTLPRMAQGTVAADVHLPSPRSGILFLFFGASNVPDWDPPSIQAEVVGPPGGDGRALAVDRYPPAIAVKLPAPGVRDLRLRYTADGPARPEVRAAVLLGTQ